MYQVYTQQRPGRPRWALGSSAILLLITVGLAWALIRHKSQLGQVALRPFSAGGIKGGLPADWQPLPLQSLPEGTLAAAAEPAGDEELGRRLYVFKADPFNRGSAPNYALSVGREYLSELTAELILPGTVRDAPIAPTRGDQVAGLPALTVRRTGSSASGPLTALARVGISPEGRVLGLALITSGPIRPADIRLLDRVGRQLELPGLKPLPDPAAAMKAAGIMFDLPPGALLLDVGDLGAPRLRVASGGRPAEWELDIARVPVVASRTPDQLTRDLALVTLHQAELTSRPEPITLGERQGCRLVMNARGTSDPVALVWCVSIDAGTALMLLGEVRGGQMGTLDAVCRSIAQNARVEVKDALDVQKGLQQGREWLGRLQREGFEQRWAPLLNQPQVYLLERGGAVQERETHVYERQRRESQTWWRLRVRATPPGGRRPDRRRVNQEEVSRLQEKGNGAEYEYTGYDERGQKQVVYAELRVPGSADLARSLKLSDEPARQDVMRVDDSFAPQAVVVAAAAEMARQGASSPAIFMTTEPFPAGAVYWILRPAGERTLPWSARGERARTVCLQIDYRTNPVLMYFSSEGLLMGYQFSADTWYRLAGDDEVEAPA